MRKDIEVHIGTGDITLKSKLQYTLRDFQWVENPTGLSRYIYAEVTVPSNYSEQYIKNNGVFVFIPYTPKYKEFKVRVKRLYENGSYEYIQNPVDGTDWFLAKVSKYGKNDSNAFASQLIEISDDDFYISFDSGVVRLYSALQSDLNIIKADRQNSNMLLACVPTNNYRYPLTGVGLVRWTNGNMDYTKLADRIESEFSDDGMVVNNASFDYDTKQLSIDASTPSE